MNRIEELRQKLLTRVPDVIAEIDAPMNEDAPWFMDARVGVGGTALVVEWRPGVGFGVSSRGEEAAYGDSLPDEFFSDGLSALERVVDLLLNDKRTTTPTGLDLKSLRARRFVSQQQLAALMGITQATVSKFEHRGEDLSVAALRSTLATLGGQLEIRARFGDRLVSIDLTGDAVGTVDEVSISEHASTIAHSLRNMFGAIRSAGEQLIVRKPSTRDDVHTILAAAAAGVELTNNFLKQRGTTLPKTTLMHVDERVRALVPLLQRVAGDGITLTLELNAPIACKGEASDFDQVLFNLVINARDAMPRGGTVNISTSADTERVQVCVSDTGIGMTTEIASRAFEPFFSTKPDGAGLGLAMVHRFVKAAQGEIGLESNSGGTTFRIALPHADIVRAPEAKPRTVLVVEDDPLMRRAIARLLMSNDFDVLTAERPTDALSTLKVRKDVGLVLLDIGMPEMTGFELAQKFEDEHLDVAVIFVSGIPIGVVERSRVGSRPFLAKPFGNDDLIRQVRAVLDAA